LFQDGRGRVERWFVVFLVENLISPAGDKVIIETIDVCPEVAEAWIGCEDLINVCAQHHIVIIYQLMLIALNGVPLPAGPKFTPRHRDPGESVTLGGPVRALMIDNVHVSRWEKLAIIT
jgi:hypothetical protein